MGLFGSYTYKAKNKEKWWLHVKERGKVKLYYFSKNPDAALPGIPRGYELSTNLMTGLPLLRKQKKAEKKETKQ